MTSAALPLAPPRRRPPRGARSAVTALGLATAAVALAGAAPSPPPVERLFGCPLQAPTAGWRAPAKWAAETLDEVRVQAVLPAAWRRSAVPGRVEITSPGGDLNLSVRRGADPSPGGLVALRRGVEASELGPSHAGTACGRALAAEVARVTGLSDVSVGVYGRPLADRRRSYAVFARDRHGPLVGVVTARWSARASGPDLGLVRRLLAAVRRGP